MGVPLGLGKLWQGTRQWLRSESLAVSSHLGLHFVGHHMFFSSSFRKHARCFLTRSQTEETLSFCGSLL